MPNKKLLELIKQGCEGWNAWRRENPYLIPDLSAAELSGADLRGANLSGADLNGAYLKWSKLRNADLSWAQLSGANLSRAELSKAKLCGTHLRRADLRRSDLTHSQLNGANLSKADLSGASLVDTDLSEANLRRADLTGANLSGANLRGSDLSWTDLSRADLSWTDVSNAIVAYSRFGDNDLSTVRGLPDVVHMAPSTVGIDTLFKSNGKIPEVFLQGVGVPEGFITLLPSLIEAMEPIQFHSCFISYSHQDEDFSRRLHSRMRSENLRVWYAPEDMKGGRKLHEEIFRAIQVHDKLLLVLSENSMNSEWVITEMRRARKVEREEKRRKLFPIRLVDFGAIQKWECFDADGGKDLAVELREYYIPDFSNWKDHDAFEAEFAKLLRALKATEN